MNLRKIGGMVSMTSLVVPLAGAAVATQAPRTLFELSGVSLSVPAPEEAVLVLIDAQKEYTEGSLVLSGVKAAVEEARRVLAAARTAGVPVVHVVHQAVPGAKVFDPQGPMVGIIESLQPVAGEVVVVKHYPDSFQATTLGDLLAKSGRRKLVVLGFMTHMCVSTTVRSAMAQGYACTVVGAACASRDLRGLGGRVLGAPIIHEAELAALGDRFAQVIANSDALAWAVREK